MKHPFLALVTFSFAITSTEIANAASNALATPEVDVVGWSKDSNQYGLRIVTRFEESDARVFCAYPKIQGRVTVGLEYLLCEKGQGCSKTWTIHEVVKTIEACTPAKDSNERTAEAKRAFGAAGIDINGLARPISVERDRFEIPASAMKPLGISAVVRIFGQISDQGSE